MHMLTAKVMAPCPCKEKIHLMHLMRMNISIATMMRRMANMMRNLTQPPLPRAQPQRLRRPVIPMHRERSRTRIDETTSHPTKAASCQVIGYVFGVISVFGVRSSFIAPCTRSRRSLLQTAARQIESWKSDRVNLLKRRIVENKKGLHLCRP